MSYWPISVAGIKVNGMQNGAALTTGPTSTGGITTYKKHMLWVEMYGDAGYAPTLWAGILDNDFIDTPIYTYAPGYVPSVIGW